MSDTLYVIISPFCEITNISEGFQGLINIITHIYSSISLERNADHCFINHLTTPSIQINILRQVFQRTDAKLLCFCALNLHDKDTDKNNSEK